jgi:isoaspartyl peptidase/L-asparaginase-like protein (Ntn-hydrolase superfamily)
MKERSTYYNFDRKQVDALDAAIEACELGDVPDFTLGIIAILQMNGWKLEKAKK